jgi:hypothetical protein
VDLQQGPAYLNSAYGAHEGNQLAIFGFPPLGAAIMQSKHMTNKYFHFG